MQKILKSYRVHLHKRLYKKSIIDFFTKAQPLINIQTNHLLQQENFEEAFHLYNYIEEKDKFYFQLGNMYFLISFFEFI